MTTDIIVGFPGETEEDFQETLSLVREVQFDNAFVFKYSKRRGTPAVELPEQLAPAVIEDRHARLLTQVNEIATSKLQPMVGTKVEVLAEGLSRKNPARLEGRTRCNKLVVFEGSDRHRAQLLDIQIVRTSAFTLYGELATINLD